MLKQKLIIALLLLAFGVVLTHSIVPHHHHHSVAEATNHTHDNPLEQSLEWYKHAGNTGDYFLGSSHDFYFQASEWQDIFYVDFKLKDVVEPLVSKKIISRQHFVFSRTLFPLLSFRGPPQA